MDRQEFERLAHTMSQQASASWPTAEHAAKFLAFNGVEPDVLPRTSRYLENVQFLGAIEWPTATKGQRKEICDEWGWSDPEDIAFVAIASTTARNYGSDIIQPMRTVVVLQMMNQDVQIYWMDGNGNGWTTSPVTDILASF